MITRNKSISATTLHTALNLHSMCMQRGIHLNVNFFEDNSQIQKVIKLGDRIFWMDYGTNLNIEELEHVITPFRSGIQVLVFPSVIEGINWDMFSKKTLAGSKEPDSQRGLSFDTEVGKKISDGLYECESTSARVWAMDSKPVDKKIRGGKVNIILPANNLEMFKVLKNQDIKIAASTKATVVCHYVHECFGNILDTSGLTLQP